MMAFVPESITRPLKASVMNLPGEQVMQTRQQPAADDDFLRGIDMFFEGRGQVHQSMRRLIKHLKKPKYPMQLSAAWPSTLTAMSE